MIEINAENEAATGAVAAKIASLLVPGDVLCLSGDLGSGKTTFTRALTATLGSPALVSSPTFTLIHEYHGGRLPVYHMDAYRLRGGDDVITVGLEEYLSRNDGVTVIEWPERIADILPPDCLWITLTEVGEGRAITLKPQGKRWEAAIHKGMASGD